MKQLALTLSIFSACCRLAFAGTAYTGKEMKQVAPTPCPQWYADNEWNVSLWGTYAMTGTEFAPNPSLADIIQSTTEGHTVYGTFDRYLGGDHAWGGGIDLKYFFRRYFGIGIEGFVLDAHRGAGFNLERGGGPGIGIHDRTSDQRAVGEVLATFTLRYPIGCSRFAPYAWAGGGVIFGGGERDEVVTGFDVTGAPVATTEHSEGEGKAIGQFGGGIEVRITRHIGWMNDFSWNVVDGPKNN